MSSNSTARSASPAAMTGQGDAVSGRSEPGAAAQAAPVRAEGVLERQDDGGLHEALHGGSSDHCSQDRSVGEKSGPGSWARLGLPTGMAPGRGGRLAQGLVADTAGTSWLSLRV